ncbi:lysophospholipid acyltransferase family protein [Pontibacillus sp. HN14]
MLKRMFRFHFNHLHYTGPLPASPNHTLFLVNHSAWWDPLIIFLLNKHLLKADGYGMMHEEGVKSFPIFKRIGTFSINRSNPKDVIASLNYAKDLLDNEKAVWMFPQGEERPLEIRPLGFQPGASYLIEKTKQIQVIPVSLYYTFEGTRKPNVYVKLGQNLMPSFGNEQNRRQRTKHVEKLCTDQLEELKREVIEKHQFHTLF